MRNSNDNIRQREHGSQANIAANYHLKANRVNTLIGKQRNRVYMSHLSCNREISNYQNIETVLNSEMSIDKLNAYTESFEMAKITHKIEQIIRICSHSLDEISRLRYKSVQL